MTPAELKTALAGGKRTLALRAARQLAALGGHPNKGRKVTDMVSAIQGRKVSKHDRWVWLLERLETLPPSKAAVRRRTATANRLDREAFYRSPQWRAVRFDVLKDAGGRCVLCGSGGSGVILHVDHIKPRSLRPDLSLEPKNLQCLCEDCNLGKSNRDDTDWRTRA